ncbi:MAG: hypothetical protein R6X33_03945 [Candidatus Brocadiia bacterium]
MPEAQEDKAPVYARVEAENLSLTNLTDEEYWAGTSARRAGSHG